MYKYCYNHIFLLTYRWNDQSAMLGSLLAIKPLPPKSRRYIHKKIPKTVTVGDIDEDISQLRGVLENPDDERSIDDENSFNEDIYTQNYSESQPHNFTQTQSQINIPSNTSTVTHVTSQPHTSTNIPPYTSTVTHSTSYPHTSHAIETSHPIHTLPGHSFMVNHQTNNSYQFQDNLRR